ncbi:hypothetical protein [Pseudomonas sp. URMO17WK12:I11]|uniref:hypothetical protein n=1 Tax=Pseudomonas sp. URMO17WK12:I11 TaxID=1283291 RepID=UPI00119F2A77|nr:hypothetical protein [Pseudomonas sp. URMO17WK12:I11]
MTAFAEWLLGIIQDILQFFADLPIAIAGWLWEALLFLLSSDYIVAIIEHGGLLFSQIDPSVWYFMNIFQIPFGITAILAAYVLRFSIRRLPFIG